MKKCYDCDGYKQPCETYAGATEEGLCVWYTIIQNDIDKVLSGNECLTFPTTRTIMQDKILAGDVKTLRRIIAYREENEGV